MAQAKGLVNLYKKQNLEGELKDKILAVNGVPQVVTYTLNGEVDAGYINQTELRSIW